MPKIIVIGHLLFTCFLLGHSVHLSYMHTGQFYEKAELDIPVSYLTYLPKFKTKKVEKN